MAEIEKTSTKDESITVKQETVSTILSLKSSVPPAIPKRDEKEEKTKTKGKVTVRSPRKRGIASKKASKRPVQQSAITEHFSIRRSTRKTKAVIESEKSEAISKKLLSKDESGLKSIDIEGKGRGVVTTRPFTRDELICEYSGDLITYEEAKKREEQYEKDSSIGCYMYYFKYKTDKLCVDATRDNGRFGRLVNHSKTASNVVTKLIPVNDQPFLCLMAARDIEVGEELQYDYGERSKKVIESHPWLTS